MKRKAKLFFEYGETSLLMMKDSAFIRSLEAEEKIDGIIFHCTAEQATRLKELLDELSRST